MWKSLRMMGLHRVKVLFCSATAFLIDIVKLKERKMLCSWFNKNNLSPPLPHSELLEKLAKCCFSCSGWPHPLRGSQIKVLKTWGTGSLTLKGKCIGKDEATKEVLYQWHDFLSLGEEICRGRPACKGKRNTKAEVDSPQSVEEEASGP